MHGTEGSGSSYSIPTANKAELLVSSARTKQLPPFWPMEDLDDSLEGEEALQPGTELTSTHECI